MSTPITPPKSPDATDARVTPAPASQAPAEDLDLEEDIAPNLGGEDQMQDA